jgi:hypothetical protein
MILPPPQHPFLQEFQVGWVSMDFEGNLVGTPKVLHLMTVHFLGAGPAFGSSKNGHGPLRAGGHPSDAGFGLDTSNFAYYSFQCLGHPLVHGFGVRAFNEIGFIAITGK